MSPVLTADDSACAASASVDVVVDAAVAAAAPVVVSWNR
jgi:hypothetical protein